MTMPIRVRKSAKDRKAEIVETAIRLAAETGPDRLTTQMLADTIGISQPAIFRHFASKGMIWQAVAEHITKRMEKAQLLPFDEVSPRQQLRDLVERHLAFIEMTPAIPAILFSRELHAENDELRAHFAGLMANRHAIFAELFNEGRRRGEFDSKLVADDAAYLVLALIQGLAMRWSLNARSFDLVLEGGRLLDLQMAAFTPG